MKRFMSVLLLVALLGTGVPVLAQTPAPAEPAAPPPVSAPAPFPADARVAYINFQTLVTQSKLGQAGRDQLQALATKNDQALTELSGRISALEQELQSQANVLAPAVVTQKSGELTRLQRDAQYMQESNQLAEQTLEQQLLAEFQERAFPIFEQIRRERNLWVILSTDSAIVALAPGLDISPEVVSRLDAAQ